MIPIDTATGLQAEPSPHGTRPAACYGMTCPHRGQCALYAALGLADGFAIVHCRRGDSWPFFVRRADV